MSTRLTIPAPAFMPRNSTIEYDTNGVRLNAIRIPSGVPMFIAPVFLPHGAIIDQVGMRVHDTAHLASSAQITLKLLRVTSGFSKMAELVAPLTAPGDFEATVDGQYVDHRDIDTAYGYVLQLELPVPLTGQTRQFYQAWIDYS